MPIVAADWSITRANGNIRYIGDDHGGTAPSYATVIEFRRWLGGLSDDAVSSGDDEYDITDDAAADRKTDNFIQLLGSYNIDDTAAEHLYDGSITQGSGPTETFYDGVVNFGNIGVRIGIHQDGAVLADDWWNFNVGGTHDGGNNVAVLTDSGESWTTDEWVGYVITNTTDGSEGVITANTATTITATLEGGTDNDWDTSDNYLISEGLNSDANAGISHRFMIKTRDNGVDIDGRRLIGINRAFGRTYGEFKINGTSRGNNVLALSDSADLNNTTAIGTVAGWNAISNTEGLRLIDANGDTVNEEYYSEWDRDTFTINQFFERTKWLSRINSASTLNGMPGDLFRGITHSFAYDGETGGSPATNDVWAWGTAIAYDNEASGPFTVGDVIHEDTATPVWKGTVLAVDDNGTTGTLIVNIESGTVTDNESFSSVSGSSATADVAGTPTAVTGGGTMAMLAVDDDGATGNLYVQVLKGTAPANNTRIYDDADAAQFLDVNGTVTERTISTPFSGVSTGSAIIGSYGLGIEAADLSASDRVFDLTNTQIIPPNNVTFTVFGLVSGEDRVLVTPEDGSGGLDYDQMSLDVTLDGAAETAVDVDSIPVDTPSSGTIRIQLDDGRYRRVAYTSYTGSVFTIGSTDFTNPDDATAGNNVFVSYIDLLATGSSENFQTVYNADRTLFVRVRDGGGTPIKPFETTGTLGSSGGSATAIRTSDE